MTITAAEETRLQNIETTVADIGKAIRNLVAKAQIDQLMLLRQKELEAINDRLTVFETALVLLQKNLG